MRGECRNLYDAVVEWMTAERDQHVAGVRLNADGGNRVLARSFDLAMDRTAATLEGVRQAAARWYGIPLEPVDPPAEEGGGP